MNNQEAQINSLQSQNEQLRGLLDQKLLVDAINQAVTTSLKVNSQSMTKSGSGNNGTVYVSRHYLGKPWPSHLEPGVSGSLSPDLVCWYCRDTGHHKENCIKLNHQLVKEQWRSDQNSIAPNVCSTNLANWRLLCLWTRAREQPRVVQEILWELTMCYGHFLAVGFQHKPKLILCKRQLQNALR